MINSEFIEHSKLATQNYICKGQHFIKNCSKDDLETDVAFAMDNDVPRQGGIDKLTKEIWNKLEKRMSSTKEVNFIFTGNVENVAQSEQKQWFLSCLSARSNKVSNYFFNKKLKILTDLTDLFLTVFSKDGPDIVKCNFQHCLLESVNATHSNIHSNLVWFDHTLASRGNRNLSAYRIFYIVAIGSDNRVVQSSTGSLVEGRFISPERLQTAKSEMNRIPRLLTQINFSEHEIKNIFEIIIGLIELSQYRAQGDGKKLEFNGTGHLKKGAEHLLVKEKQLRDFIVNEYLWVDNKRKLKSPEIVNSEIDSFIYAIYDVLLNRILDKYNRYVETDPGNGEYFTAKFLYALGIPNFEKDKIFEYGDFHQYYLSTLFESASANVISKESDIFIKSSGFSDVSPAMFDSKRTSVDMQNIRTMFELITGYKNAKDRSDYLQKLERKDLKTIKFLRINHHIYVDIFIPEVVSFIRFDWQSFIDGSELQSSKQIMSFLKLSGNLVIQDSKVQRFSGRIWNSEDISNIFPDKPFDGNIFFIHSLVDDCHQSIVKYPLKSQINNGNLQFLQNDQLTFATIALQEFVEKYHVVFLNVDDISRTRKEAVIHAIHRLQLSEAWCCSDFIHLRPCQIEQIECQVNQYHRSVVKVQEYARIILSKIKLKNLRIMAYQYREEYLEAVKTSVNFVKRFAEEYLPVVNVDRENICLKMVDSIKPTVGSVEKLKFSGKDKNVPWLHISIMSKTSILHKETLSSSKVCVLYSNDQLPAMGDCLNIGHIAPDDVRLHLNNVFILRISNEVESGDVLMDVKTENPLFVWNVETEVNKTRRKYLPQSCGYLYSRKTYRLFSTDYFIKKLAYNTLNGISYATFNDLVQECSTTIILQSDPVDGKSLTKAPLWISVTNCLPLVNLQSTTTFNAVEKQRALIDKKECAPHVTGMYTRPRHDWLMENVSAQLLLVSLQNDNAIPARDSVDNRLSSCSSDQRDKLNYKTRKYKQK